MQADDLSPVEENALLKLVLKRYSSLIDEKESRPISELRQRLSPHTPFIRALAQRLIVDIRNYEPSRDFFTASEKAIDYIRKLKTVHLPFSFFQAFEEIESTKAASPMDKAMLLTTLLRHYGSEDARVIVSKKGKSLVRFAWKGTEHYVIAESGSLIVGDEVWKLLSEDGPAYSFNDLEYENFEED